MSTDHGCTVSTKKMHHHNVSYRHTYYDVDILPCVLSVTSIWCQSLFTLR